MAGGKRPSVGVIEDSELLRGRCYAGSVSRLVRAFEYVVRVGDAIGC